MSSLRGSNSKAARPVSARLARFWNGVLPLSGIERFDGGVRSRPIDFATWRQVYDEIRRASLPAPFQPATATLAAASREAHRTGVIPIAILDARYDRLGPEAVDPTTPAGRRTGVPDEALTIESRVFAASPLVDHTYRGAGVRFALDRSLFFTNDVAPPLAIAIDFDERSEERRVGKECRS